MFFSVQFRINQVIDGRLLREFSKSI